MNASSQSDRYRRLLEVAQTGDLREIRRLIRSSDSKIIDALLQNYQLTVELLIQMIRSRKLSQNHLTHIARTKKWIRNYKVKLELVLNPQTPRHISLGFVKDLYQADLAAVSRDTTLHPALRESAENFLKIRMTSMAVGERIALAKIASVPLIRYLLVDEEPRVVKAVLNNFRLPEIEVVRMANDRSVSSDRLALLCEHPKWSKRRPVIRALALNPSLGYAWKRRVFEMLSIPYLIELAHSPALNINEQKLARFIVRQKLQNLTQDMLSMLATSHSSRLLRELSVVISDIDILIKLVKNKRLTGDTVVQMIQRNPSERLLEEVSRLPWRMKDDAVRKAVDTLKARTSGSRDEPPGATGGGTEETDAES